MAEGIVLNIDGDLLDKLKEADDGIKNLSTSAKEASESMNASFKKVAEDGLKELIDALKNAKSDLDSIKDVKLDYGKSAEETSKVVDKVNELVESLEKVNSTGGNQSFMVASKMNIAELKDMIDEITKQLEDSENKLGEADQQRLVNLRDYYKRELSLQEESDQKKLDSYEKQKEANMKMLASEFDATKKGLESVQTAREKYEREYRAWIEKNKEEQKKMTDAPNNEMQKQWEIAQKEQQSYYESVAKNEDDKRKDIARTRDAALDAAKAIDEGEREYAESQRKLRENNRAEIASEYEDYLRKTNKAQADEKKYQEDYRKWIEETKKTNQGGDESSRKAMQESWEEAKKNQQSYYEQIARNEDSRRKEIEKTREKGLEAAEALEKRQQNLAKLESSLRKSSYERYTNSYEGAMRVSEKAKSVEDSIQAIKRLEAAKKNLSRTDDEYYEKIGNLNREIAKHKSIIDSVKISNDKMKNSYSEFGDSVNEVIFNMNKLWNAQRKINKENREIAKASATDVIDYAKSAKSMNELKAAAKELKKAMDNLDPRTIEWKNLNRVYGETRKRIKLIEDAMKSVKKQHHNLMDTSDQLARKLALLFSVSAITGYINKLIDVRGEFELQQRSLQSILQNKDEADKLFQKTVQLAVQSPFRVGQLVSYTKQLAAYRVETEKLYNTNKMLADVSAGLGVDMQRLILAFGQVKAANYLRGTELRQFSEAGINILGELSKYFTEIEGHAVSVGDVFERVSARMVKFSDVEEIFRRITAQGGVFYNMQEVQAKTLSGMVSNLKDSIDIMFNDIGKANDSTLKEGVTIIREFVENWREVAQIIKEILILFSPMIAYYGAVKIADTKVAQGLLNIAMNSNVAANGLIKVERGCIRLSRSLGLGTRGAIMLKTALGSIATLGITAAIAGITYGILELWRVSTKARREADALEETLDGIYSEDLANFKKQQNGFENLVNRLKDANKGSQEHRDLIAQINSQYGEYLGYIVDETTSYDKLKSSIDSVNRALLAKAKTNTFEKAFNEKIKKTTAQIQEARDYLTELLRGKRFSKKGENGLLIVPTKDELNDIFNLFESRIEKAGGKAIPINELWASIDEYGLSVSDKGVYSFDKMHQYADAILEQAKAEKEINEQINGIYTDRTAKTYEHRKALEELNTQREKELKNAKKIGDESSIAYKNEVARIQKEFQKKKINLEVRYEGLDQSVADKRIADLNKFSKTIIDVNKKIAAAKNELGEEYADLITIDEKDAATSVGELAKSTADSYKLQQTRIKELNSLKEAGTAYDETELENAKKSAAAYLFRLKILGREDLLEKANKSQNVKDLKILKNRIALIKEMNKAYEKERELYDDDIAKQRVADAYAKTFKEAFGGTSIHLKKVLINENKIKEAVESGKAIGGALSEGVKEKLEELKNNDTYIRDFSEKGVELIKAHEAFREKAYKGKDNKWTIGYGETKGVKEGDTITKEEADAKLRKRLTEDFKKDLNDVLNIYNNIILTQEQYDSLLDLTYQGGKGAILSLMKYANDVDKGANHIVKIHDMIKQKVGDEAAERFGDAFVKKFKEAENVYERIAMLLQTMNLTVKGNINDDYKGLQKRSNERYSMFSGDLDIANMLKDVLVEIDGIDFTNLQGVANILRGMFEIAKEEGKESVIALQKAISEVEVQIGNQKRGETLNDLSRRIEDMFSGYEITLQFAEMGVDKNLAEKFTGRTLFSLDDIAKNDAALKEMLSSYGDKGIKIYKKFQEMLAAAQDRQTKERIKTYAKYLKEEVSERINIERDAARQIEEIQAESAFTPTMKTAMISNVIDDMQKKMDSLNWDAFKDSDLYVQMFSDLDYVSTGVLEKIKRELLEIRDASKQLSPSELKEMQKQLSEIDEELSERNPFENIGRNLIDYIKNMKKLREVQERAFSAKKEEKAAKDKVDMAQRLVDKQRKITAATNNNVKATKEEKIAERARLAQAEALLKVAIKEYAVRKNISEEEAKALLEQQSNTKTSKEQMMGVAGQISQAFEGLPQAVENMQQIFGFDYDQKTQDIVESISAIGSGIANATKQFASNDYVGGTLSVLGTIAEFFKIGDKKKERQIQKQIKLVEKLQEEYEKLAERIEKAYEINEYESAFEASESNLKQQIRASQEIINLEESKKKTNKKRIEEEKKNIEEYQKTLKELREKRIEDLGGFGSKENYKNAAESFVEAWLQAYKETKDGLKGLDDEFKKFFEDMVKKQLVMRATDKYLSDFYKSFDKMFAEESQGGGNVTKDELDRIKNLWSTTSTGLDSMLKSLVESLGIVNDLTNGKDKLSGLQEGIQGVTEQTAQILEFYISSMRLYVADSNDKLKQLVNMLSDDVVVNPMLAQLQIIARQTTAINSLLNSITAPYPNGGRGFKVIM